MIKVLCISDTHGRNQRWIELINKIKPNIVLHCGDHCTEEEIMNKYADFWVAGNNDYIGNEIELFKLENVKFILFHGHQAARFNLKKWKQNLVDIAKKHNVDAMIYGHSHIQDIDSVDGIVTINPGSLELPRNAELLPTYATFEVVDNKIQNIKIEFYDFN
ncbi:YfcE family phosphodiesterase [Mycoplasmoides pirum]|uniref:YfcE family phosphodiesterase n=1 Tax=Mycoplasmoides pirum TaxID=2122 RepID=UPI00048A0A6A|nr:YfcE family phosphodiesterase [Mycoplasmoides pirum]